MGVIPLIRVVTIGFKELGDLVDGAADRMKNLSPAVAERVREATQAIVRENFETEGAASGHPWPPLKASTVLDRRRKGFPPRPILVRTGRLKRSATLPGSESVFRSTNDSVTVGTSVSYARFHRTGTRHLPRRDPFRFAREQLQRVLDVFRRWALRGEA